MDHCCILYIKRSQVSGDLWPQSSVYAIRPSPAMITSSAAWLLSGGEQQVEVLTETLFSLDEPWRGRFLALVAQRAIGESWNGRQPERGQIATWLHDVGVYRDVARLLEAWRITGR